MTNTTADAIGRIALQACIALAALSLSACGGGGDDGSDVPLWLPTDVKLADVDGDGRRDVVALSSRMEPFPAPQHGQVNVWRQGATVGFATSESYPVGFVPWTLEITDIDGDGAPDLVLTDVAGRPGTVGGVWMLRQDPARRGMFRAAERLVELPRASYQLVVGDVNGDGAPDVVATTSLSGWSGATLLLQDQGHRGSFLAPVTIELTGLSGSNVALGDLDGDGRNDLVFRVHVGVNATALGIRKGQPDGTLGPWVELSAAQRLNSELLAVADVNRDGHMDILETLCCEGGGQVIALVQQQDGGFVRVSTSLAGLPGQEGQVFADLDGDGRPDFATAGSYPLAAEFLSPPKTESRLHVLRQDGSGAFQVTQTVGLEFADEIAAGDVDGDGLNDLVVFDHRGGRPMLQVLRQLPTSRGVFVLGQTVN